VTSRFAALAIAFSLAVLATVPAPRATESADNPWAPAEIADNARVGAVWAFTAQPENPLVLLAASHTLGLLRSSDSGAHWTQPAGAITKPLWVVAFDPFTPNVAYAGSQGFGAFKSTDAGQTWTATNNGLRSLDVRTLDFGKGLVVAGTGKGVFITQDGGETWFTQGLGDFAISAVSVYVKNPPFALLAGVDHPISQRGYLLKNANLGATWSTASSQDGKKTGFPIDSVVASVAAGPLPSGSDSRPIFVGTHAGLYRSDDGANTFLPVSGLQNLSFNSIAFNPNSADQVFVGSDGGGVDGGLFRSVDRGATWTPLQNGLPNHLVVAVGLSPSRPVQVLAGLWDPGGRSVGLYRSEDTALAPTPGASAAPSVVPASATPRGSANPVGRPRVGTAPAVDARMRILGLVGLAVLAVVVLFLFARRRRMAREDRLTRE
jgi:photosystem II stability/assembly factor-like uncharacterized protein